jgi:hypothetical protein
MTFSKYKCWQTERIGRVVAKAAFDIDRATFLATHMPMRRIFYETSPLEILNTNENGLLAELNRMNTEDLHVFAVIKGIPGTGKSHLIRWLFEKYKQEHPGDNIILIERANTSLKRTIEQIISSGMFESSSFANELKQLKGATDALSASGLEDTLLNHLQVGVQEMEAKWGDKLHRRIAAKKIATFLLDFNVRKHLKKENGPIKRVVRYMQEGRGIEEDEAPGFEPEDLSFDAQQKHLIRDSGYQDAQDIADVISRSNDRHRVQLTRYMNFVLRNYAISKTTNLNASDLREMFNELRRELRKKGQSLALFIEDITAFTGIDAGLVDVLITEHRGESNKEFCRIASVVGITDAFFMDSIPENVRDRISHLLSLNTSSQASDMLNDNSALVEFAARYLNAIRLNAKTLKEWEISGANFDQIPNLCSQCDYRITCHTAFGKVDISMPESKSGNEIGLYPFNKNTLVRMYQSLEDNVSRTPRAFLNDIIFYILQNHSEKVATGKFPPRDITLAPKLKTLQFDPLPHRRVIEEQGKEDVDRLITLLLFWGNRNVFEEIHNGKTLIGGLPFEIFQAFALPTFAGRTNATTEVSPQKTSKSDKPPSLEDEERSKPTQPAEKKEILSIKYVADWANGESLHGHNDFLKWMGQLFIHSIDWQYHDIAPTRVPSAGQASSFFAIEGQVAQIFSNRLVFKRSLQLRYALEALAHLNNKEISLSPDQYGEYITALHIWIETEEHRIAGFLRDRSRTENLIRATYPKILVENAVLLACLSGNFSQDMSFFDIYNSIAITCIGKENEHKRTWKNAIKTFSHDHKRASIMSKLQANVGIVREETLQQFNSVQGDSSDIQFLKGEKLYRILKEFEENEWELTDILAVPPSGFGQRYWESALKIRAVLKNDFSSYFTNTYNDINITFDKIQSIVGSANPSIVFDKISDLLQELQSISPVDPSLRSDLLKLRASEFNKLEEEIAKLKGYHSNIQIAKHLSPKSNKLKQTIDFYHSYLANFQKEVERTILDLRHKTAELPSANQAAEIVQDIDNNYIALVQKIEQILQEE